MTRWRKFNRTRRRCRPARRDRRRLPSGTIQQPGVALPGIDDRWRMRLDRVDAAPDIHHRVDVLLDELHRGHHLADALAREILEVAGLEDRDHAFLDLFAEQLLLVRRGVARQRGSRLIDRLGGLEDLLGRLFGAADHGPELASDLGPFLAVKTLAMQNRDLALGAADRIGNEVDFDLELLTLLDLGAEGFQYCLGSGDLAQCRWIACCRHHAGSDAGHLGADRAQLGHDLAVHRAEIAAVRDFRRRHGAGEGFFNTKTLAMNRHEFFSQPRLSRVLDRCDLTWSSRRELARTRARPRHTKALTMCCLRSLKINAAGRI